MKRRRSSVQSVWPALLRAGLLRGHKTMVYRTKESLTEYEQSGVEYTGEDVVVDDRYVTASRPREFGRAIAGKLV